MGFSPLGVAMGVSGEAHSHDVHPVGHVPLALGMWHPSISPIGPGTLQQSSPGLQQFAPQHVPAGPQSAPLHGGALHTPLSQYGVVGSHLFPHAPQLLMSLLRFVHAPPQHVKSQKPHALPPEPAVPLELVELAAPPAPPAPPLPPVPMEPPSPPAPADPDELEVDCPPPCPPEFTSAPQPAMDKLTKPKKRMWCFMKSIVPRLHERRQTVCRSRECTLDGLGRAGTA